jgi:Na+-transporting NADH:ubiquinone oxidoreductase subunit C
MAARKEGAVYTLFFAGIVCTVSGLFVSGAAVYLRSRQEENKKLDMQRNVLLAANLIDDDAETTPGEVQEMFKERVREEIVTLKTGEPDPEADPATFDQREAAQNPETSTPAPPNPAKVARIPNDGRVFHIMDGDRVDRLVLPVEGKGLWSTLYGFLALDGRDPKVVRGISFYEQGETPGLGGEVENPKWRALWNGRQAMDSHFNPVIEVIKGKAGPVSEDPRHVDGLSGATLTSNGVTALVQFWLGEHGFGPYLERYVKRGGGSGR